MKISVDNGQYVDVLGRVKFARHLLDVAEAVDANSSGVVIGLEGVWGSGKTAVLNSLDQVLDERDANRRTILIRFNPWMVSGTSDLVAAMLIQIAAELPEGNATGFWGKQWQRFRKIERPGAAAAALISYASLLGTVKHLAPVANYLLPGSGLALEAAGNAFDYARKDTESVEKALKKWKRSPRKLSINESRKHVEEQLKQLRRRVVVVVDDLDRLPPHELAAMIQAVKAVGNFPNVVYLLAFDPNLAQAGLQAALGLQDGRAFLEKVVQLSLVLPEIPAARMTNHAVSRLRSALDTVVLAAAERTDLEMALVLAAALMKSPRDVERLRTRLLVAGPVLIGEVNIADVTILEAISVKHPNLISWLKENSSAVFNEGLYQYDNTLRMRGEFGQNVNPYLFDEEERRLQAEKNANAWAELLPATAQIREPAVSAMEFLFDKCRSSWHVAKERSDFRRVQQFRYWYRWRCFHDHQERWPVAEINRYLRQPDLLCLAEISNSRDDFIEICQHICDVGFESLISSDAVAMVEAFASLERSFGTETMIDRDLGFGPLNALIVGMRLDTPTHRQQAIMSLINTASVWLSCSVLFVAQKDLAKQHDGERISQDLYLLPTTEAFDDAIQKWFEVADSLVKPECIDVYQAGFSPYTLLCWMTSLKRDPATIRSLAEMFFSYTPEKIQMFFSTLADSPSHESFPIQVNWDILPACAILNDAVQRAPGFEKTHSNLMKLIRSRVGEQS